MNKVPKSLQPILWSRDVKNLDVSEDKEYIVNQVLAYGTIKHLRWLFKTYSEDEIKKVFLNRPMKVYSASSFDWIKTILLKNPKLYLSEKRYVESLPRDIR